MPSLGRSGIVDPPLIKRANSISWAFKAFALLKADPPFFSVKKREEEKRQMLFFKENIGICLLFFFLLFFSLKKRMSWP